MALLREIHKPLQAQGLAPNPRRDYRRHRNPRPEREGGQSRGRDPLRLAGSGRLQVSLALSPRPAPGRGGSRPGLAVAVRRGFRGRPPLRRACRAWADAWAPQGGSFSGTAQAALAPQDSLPWAFGFPCFSTRGWGWGVGGLI